jgi:uncharacterized protein (DUF885 family)
MAFGIRTITEKFLQAYYRMNPEMASHMGIETYDELLSDSSPQGRQAWLAFAKSVREELLPFSREGWKNLPFDDAIDGQALLQSLENSIFEEEELPWSHSFPGAAMEASNALYVLFMRDYEPLPSRLAKLTSPIEKIPRLLADSQPLITTPVEVWLMTSIASCSALPGFLDTIRDTARSERFSSLPALENAVEKAHRAVDEYSRWLREDLLPRAGKEHAIGKEKFARLLTLKHFGYDADELIELGHHYLEETRGRIEGVARKIDPLLSFDEIKETIRSDYPETFDKTLSFCREAMEKSRRYVVESGFADVPEKEVLEVIETPPMFRPTTPLAAYRPPGKFAKVQRGVYMVTRTDDPGALRDFNYTALFNKSLHEGYPGHHLQFVCCNLHPHRVFLPHSGSEMFEGWAHYCEDYVATNGFPDYLALHFTMNLELIWKACRIIIDVKLSRGEMTMEEAIAMLMEKASFTRGPASGEVRRYTYTPTYQLSYLLGKHLIMEMKNDMKSRYGTLFSEKEFHNLLLYSGTIPLNLMKNVVERAFQQKKERAAVRT